MKSAVKAVSVINFSVIFLLTVSGYLPGIVGEIFYYAAFLLPLLIAIYIRKRLGIPKSTLAFKLSPDNIALTFLFATPTILLLLLLSYLTSLIFSLFEFYPPNLVDTSGNIFILILKYAFAPALFEEMLFRFVPITFIAPNSKRTAVILSALFFAFMHCNLFQIPYAFIAGLLFAFLAIITNSITAPFIIHFLNNTVSLISMKYGGVQPFDTVFVIALLSLSVISILILTVIFAKKIYSYTRELVCEKGKPLFTAEVVLFIVITFFVAVLNLFSVS